MSLRRIDEDEEAVERPFDLAMFRRLLGFLGPYRADVLWATGSIVAGALASLAFPLVTRDAINDGILRGRASVIEMAGAVYLGLALIRFWAYRVQTWRVSVLGQGVIRDLRNGLVDRILTLGSDYFDRRPVGKITTRVLNDVQNLNQLLSSGIVNSVGDLLTLFGTVVIMLVLSPKLALLSFLVLPVMAFLSTGIRRRIVLRWRLVRRGIAVVNAVWNESLIGARVVAAFRQERHRERHFETLSDMVFGRYVGAEKASAYIGPAVEMTSTVGMALVFVYGAILYVQGHVSLGLFVAFLGYLSGFWAPMQRMGQMMNQVLVAMASAERVFEVLDQTPSVIDRATATPAKRLAGAVTFEHVGFAYVPGHPVLRDVTFSVPAGTTVALVGQTGAGKTTLAGLLARTYEASEGRVSIDGRDVTDISLPSLRSQVAQVQQDPFMFDGTLADNIRYARPDADPEEVTVALRAAQLLPLVERLPEGLETRVRERGGRLSQGERQLIAFARAFLADPAILVLDEATASIDTETERLVQRALANLLEGRTAFVVAHRLSTIRRAGLILVMAHGAVVERGTHESLLEARGVYADLLKAQAAMEREGGLFRPRVLRGASS